MSLLSIGPYEFLKEEINYLDCLQHWSMKFKRRFPQIARESEIDSVQFRYLELLRRNEVKKITLILFSNSAWPASGGGGLGVGWGKDTRVLKRSPKSCCMDVGFPLCFCWLYLEPHVEQSSWCFSGGPAENSVHHLVAEFRTATVQEAFEPSAAVGVCRHGSPQTLLPHVFKCLRNAKAIAMNSGGKPSPHIKWFDRGS